ncbi:MAG TPA: DUF4118 domain-containing protein [Casimicrobiaceae bacterium]|nr:DUF4118 domain-containing protein [Casimicrobiaceae bacterium]
MRLALQWTMSRRQAFLGYASALAGVLACTLAGFAMRPRFDLVNIAMIYLLAVVTVAARFPRGPAIAAALLSVAAFDWLFVPPRGHFTVDDAQYVLTFAIMVAVALLISHLVERARRQADARARAETAADTERMRSTLLASIPHELRTPLAVMAGASSKLAEQGVPDATRRALANIVSEQAREMSTHVAEMLAMAGLEPGALRLERHGASLSSVVSNVLLRLQAPLAAHRVIVDLQRELTDVSIDAPLVEQALSNLLENCAACTPAGTVVRVRGERRGNEVVVSVEDYADRASRADLARLAAAFERGVVEGAIDDGLGLATARAIVRLHGGNAWVERMPAGGTAFRFTLPVVAAPAPAPVSSMPAGTI